MEYNVPKAKKKGQKKKLKDLKKPLIGGGLIGAVAIAGIVSGILIWSSLERPYGGTFIMGYSGGLDRIDPLLNADTFIISQIAEPLFTEMINQSSGYRENVPHLAKEGIWSSDGLNFTCILREGIEFHDHTQFNATAVKWNFDRLHRLLINMSYPWMWYHSDWTLVLNRTEILGEYTVRFVLNKPFVPFRSLLTYPQAYIVSPASTPDDRFLDVFSEQIIGTGPYIYDSNEVYVNTTIIANNNYWDTPKPIMDKLIFIPYNTIEGNERFFAKETHYAVGNDSYFEEYSSDPTIVVDEFIGAEYDYLGMNNIRVNLTMRKAISYALNYSSILEVRDLISHGSQIRCRSPLPLGTLYANWEDYDLPYYNVTRARQVLKELNWPGTENLTANNNITSGNEWEAIANSPSPLGIYNITYVIGWESIVIVLPPIITENLKQIGVKVETFPLTWGEHWGNIFTGKTDLWWIGWMIDYNDPANTLNALFSVNSDGHSNFQQTNDTQVQQWMEEGVIETNPLIRRQLYYNIQKRLIEEVYPFAWLYSPVWYDVYRSNLRGWEVWGAGSFKNLHFV
ncbi:MAG: ABC transporter substrate-binding protein [Promethearchaeota archaeon]|jgi:peptide/nickel transport system substrate-binding protein